NRKVQFQGLAFLKIKEFTFVSDCFQKGRNAEIGLFGQALNRIENELYKLKTKEICNQMEYIYTQ
nr:hypothetical protein [Prolixibacteraceae bacterium]